MCGRAAPPRDRICFCPLMIKLADNLRLREVLEGDGPFPIGVELVSTRGAMGHRQTVRVREFGEMLTHSPAVDWVSITDNAGGNPQLAPVALGTPILYAGKEVVIHLTCKDLNRHGLESQLWMLASQGFHNILAMTGDYPTASLNGCAKPVFDTDSVGLLEMVRRLNGGMEIPAARAGGNPKRLDATQFYAGAVTNSFKATENTLLPRFFLLRLKPPHAPPSSRSPCLSSAESFSQPTLTSTASCEKVRRQRVCLRAVHRCLSMRRVCPVRIH